MSPIRPARAIGSDKASRYRGSSVVCSNDYGINIRGFRRTERAPPPAAPAAGGAKVVKPEATVATADKPAFHLRMLEKWISTVHLKMHWVSAGNSIRAVLCTL